MTHSDGSVSGAEATIVLLGLVIHSATEADNLRVSMERTGVAAHAANVEAWVRLQMTMGGRLAADLEAGHITPQQHRLATDILAGLDQYPPGEAWTQFEAWAEWVRTSQPAPVA